jgi:hypothetical protein
MFASGAQRLRAGWYAFRITSFARIATSRSGAAARGADKKLAGATIASSSAGTGTNVSASAVVARERKDCSDHPIGIVDAFFTIQGALRRRLESRA